MQFNIYSKNKLVNGLLRFSVLTSWATFGVGFIGSIQGSGRFWALGSGCFLRLPYPGLNCRLLGLEVFKSLAVQRALFGIHGKHMGGCQN